MAFIIIAAVLLVINVIFMLGAIIYTLKTKDQPRLSLAPSIGSSVLQPRLSIQPQVAIYQAMVRLSISSAQPAEDAQPHRRSIEQDKTL